MTADSTPPHPPSDTDYGEWQRGWPVVLGAMIGSGSGAGLFQNLSSLFTPGMNADFGWSRGDIATASGVGLLGGLAIPFLGRLGDRIGVRPLIVGAMLLLGAAYAGLSVMTGQLWQYQLLILCLTLSVPGTSAVVYGKLIASRFTRHRGIALGVATSGLSVSTLLLSPVLGAAIGRYGWRGGFVMLGFFVVCIALPIVLLAIRRVPAGAAGTAMTGVVPPGPSGRQVRRSGTFWRLAASGLLVNLATVGLVTQLVPFGLDQGLSAGQAALLLTAYGASQIAGRLAIGLLVDRFAPRVVAMATALVSVVGFLLLQVHAPPFALITAAVFLTGLMHGAELDLLPFFTARLFGIRAYGEVFGTLLMIALIGTALGIVGFGRLHDLTGGYTIALGIATGAMALAAGAFYSLRDDPLGESRPLP